MSAMLRRCAMPMFDKGGSRSRSDFKIKHCMTYQVQYHWLPLKKLTLFPMLHMRYSSPSVIALVNDFTSLYKKIWFHPVTYGRRHDCFRFLKHPSSCLFWRLSQMMHNLKLFNMCAGKSLKRTKVLIKKLTTVSFSSTSFVEFCYKKQIIP